MLHSNWRNEWLNWVLHWSWWGRLPLMKQKQEGIIEAWQHQRLQNRANENLGEAEMTTLIENLRTMDKWRDHPHPPPGFMIFSSWTTNMLRRAKYATLTLKKKKSLKCFGLFTPAHPQSRTNSEEKILYPSLTRIRLSDVSKKKWQQLKFRFKI